jgi:1-acyl-sn-glycerol-3-phosphate acyltransferase
MAASVESLEERRLVRSRRRTAPARRVPPRAELPAASRAAQVRGEAPSGPWELLLEAGRQAWARLNPDVVTSISEEVAQRMRRIPTRLNRYGYDPWGFNADVARRALVATTLIYRCYFRVETHGVENLPGGRVMVIGNHAGQVALDAAMIGTAAFVEHEPPRILRGMGEYWLPTVPFVNELMSLTGSVVGTPKNCIDLLRNEEAVIAFPEGVRGMNKLFSERYRLQRFGSGFMRLSLTTETPIVPVAVVGSEEQAPGIANPESLARLFGMPAFPITLTWPWLGPLGMIPLPVKYRIYFGKPLRFTGDPDDEDEVIARKVGKVKRTIQSMLEQGVRERPGIFF